MCGGVCVCGVYVCMCMCVCVGEGGCALPVSGRAELCVRCLCDGLCSESGSSWLWCLYMFVLVHAYVCACMCVCLYMCVYVCFYLHLCVTN